MSPLVLVFLTLISAAVATWVYVDYRARAAGSRWERIAWWLGTLVALPVFLPIYLLAARPPGNLIRCPSCGRLTIAHRAVCQHCGEPIAFEPFPETWGLGEVLGLSLVFILTLPLIAEAVGISQAPSLGQLSVFAIAQNLLFIVLTVYVARTRYRLPLDRIGLRVDRWHRWLPAGGAIGAASIPVSLGAERIAVAVVGAVVGTARAEAMSEQEHLTDVLAGILQRPLTAAQTVWIVLLVCVLVPIGEEIFFRGFVYGTLRRWGVVAGIVLSSLFFGAVHQQIVHFLPIAILGVILALLYERTGSLLPGMVVHAVNNLVAVVGVLYHWNI
ncbi:MAG TPA: CPBP family glutamic-type intramembrane protease [bacterium]